MQEEWNDLISGGKMFGDEVVALLIKETPRSRELFHVDSCCNRVHIVRSVDALVDTIMCRVDKSKRDLWS